MPINKKITKKLTLYTLEEMLADKKLKENLLKANSLEEDEHFLSISMEDRENDLAEYLEKQGFHDVHIYYDLGCSQGSGACFDFDGCDMFKIAKNYKELLSPVNKIRYLFKDWNRGKLRYLQSYVAIKTTRNSFANLYCHSRTRNIEFDYSNSDIGDIDCYKAGFETVFRQVYLNICAYLLDELRKEYDYFTSEEFLIEDLKAREELSLFEANGTICQEFDQTNVNEEKSEVLKEVENFINNKKDYVIVDSDGKLFCNTGISDEPRDGAFLDTSDDEDLGFKKALILTKNEAMDFIVSYLQDKYDVISVEQVFKFKKVRGE